MIYFRNQVETLGTSIGFRARPKKGMFFNLDSKRGWFDFLIWQRLLRVTKSLNHSNTLIFIGPKSDHWWGTSWRQFAQDFEAEVWKRFWTWILVTILKLEFGHDLKNIFGQYFEAGICSIFWSWILVKSSKLNFGQDFDADVWLSEA